jgi:HAD superfamily phosphoserine phosphatase-like hydrolase
MQTHTTLDALLGAVDALDLPEGAWVISDADGTLWSTDVAGDAWDRLIAERRMRTAAAAAMAQVVREGGREPAVATWQAFLEGRIGDGPILAAMTFCFAGWREAEVRAFAADVYHRHVAERVYATTVPFMRGLQERGLRVAVVTGSPRLLVEEAVRGMGLEECPVLGVDLEVEAGLLSTRVREPVTWREGKVHALAPLLDGAPIAVALGDSTGDLALMEAAHGLRVLVHPRKGLRRAATERPGPWCVFAPTHTASGAPVATPSSLDAFD